MDELTENVTVHGPMEVHPIGDDLFAVVFAASRNQPDAVPQPMVWRVSETDLADLAVRIDRARKLARALRASPPSTARN